MIVTFSIDQGSCFVRGVNRFRFGSRDISGSTSTGVIFLTRVQWVTSGNTWFKGIVQLRRGVQYTQVRGFALGGDTIG